MAKSDKKKTGTRGKNRRDAHGVYQRRAERGKAAFRPYDGEPAEEFRSNTERNTGRTKRASGNAGGYGSSQRNGNSGSYSNSQRDRNSSSRPRDNYKIHTEAVNGTDVAAALLRSRVLQPRILLPVAIQ